MPEFDKVQNYPDSKVDYFEESAPIKSAVEKEVVVYLRTEQEKTTAWLAKALVIIFGSTISAFLLVILIGMVFPTTMDTRELKDLLTLILISEVGIIGTALGFYFGNQSRS